MAARVERPRCSDCASDDPARFVFCPSQPDKCDGCEVCENGFHDEAREEARERGERSEP